MLFSLRHLRRSTSQKCVAVPRQACFVRRIDCVFHSTLGFKVNKKKKILQGLLETKNTPLLGPTAGPVVRG